MNKLINFTIREIFKDEWIAKETNSTQFPFELTKGFHVKRWLPIFNAKDIPDIGTKKMKLEMDLRFIEEKWQWKYTGVLTIEKQPIEEFMLQPEKVKKLRDNFIEKFELSQEQLASMFSKMTEEEKITELLRLRRNKPAILQESNLIQGDFIEDNDGKVIFVPCKAGKWTVQEPIPDTVISK